MRDGDAQVPLKAPVDADRTCSVLDFLKSVAKVKQVNQPGTDGAESVADHMHRMACMCFLLNPEDGVDQKKCMKMALIHDLAVSITGDVVTEGRNPDKITKEEKIQKEQDAICKIAYSLGGVAGDELVSLWEELEKGETPEALHVHDMDKFEMLLQANTAQLDDFFSTTLNVFKTPRFQSLAAEVRTRRARRTKG